MIIFKHIKPLQEFISLQKKNGSLVGFVPTMGALHSGHISLILNSKTHNTVCISSIFVNPTQFNQASDFQKYPITLEKDIDLLEKNGCDILFLPSVHEIYPNGTDHLGHYDLGYLETVLEGTYRPGHFQGVCQVVHRLLTIVQPHHFYLGQKDFQQCMVIKKMIGLVALQVQVLIGSTVREDDGLAMSSRNMRLNVAERKQAVKIFETLSFIKKEIRPGYVNDLKERAVQYLLSENFRVDYVEIALASDLEIISNWDGKQKLVALAAVYLNEVRLIDNVLLN
jgi:pantoate--beta-alanine ligase